MVEAGNPAEEEADLEVGTEEAAAEVAPLKLSKSSCPAEAAVDTEAVAEAVTEAAVVDGNPEAEAVVRLLTCLVYRKA